MWARLHNDHIELLHAPVPISTPGIDHSPRVFEDWTAEELREHLSVLPAVYVDSAPSDRHHAVAEAGTVVGDRVEVTRTWVELPAESAPAQAAPVVVQSTAAGPTLADVLRVMEEVNEAKAFDASADPVHFPLLAKRAAREGCTLAEAAVRVIDELAKVKAA